MSGYRTDHATFVVERALQGSPAHAFRFWAEPALRRRWLSCHPDWTELEASFDFRVGGGEFSRLRAPDGSEHVLRAHYLDIVAGARILYAYEMSVDGRRLSASLATVEFRPAATGSTLLFTEQIAFLDGLADLKSREGGTKSGLDRLAFEMMRDLATAH